nr:uncharacterized protein LOC129261639 [Lytechinus pictus]XP_054755675.1 uncharacterized protein LOC129261639 [Lytechinus pictus]
MPSMTLTKPRRKRCVHQPEEAPFPVPIETITHKPAANRQWFFYHAQMIENDVIVQKEGDIVFLSKMGFFGKGILSRSKPEHQFFASSFQGAHRRNLPPKERRFQQQRFQQVRQHKYERHLSWQKQLLLQRRHRSNEESLGLKNSTITEDSMQSPPYKIATGSAKRVKRATVSERNHRAGITTTDCKKERPEWRLVPENECGLVVSCQSGRDSSQTMSSENLFVSSTHQAKTEPMLQSPIKLPSSNRPKPGYVEGNDRIRSPKSPFDGNTESRQDTQVSYHLSVNDHHLGTDDSVGRKFVFQSEAAGVKHTIGSSEPTSSCLPYSTDQSIKHDRSEKMLSSGQSGLVWDTKDADWADHTEVRRVEDEGHGGKENNKELLDSSRIETSAWSLSSWRTDPADWNQGQDVDRAQSHSQSCQRRDEIGFRGIGPSQIAESNSLCNDGQDGGADGATTSGSYTGLSALGLDQTSIEDEKKRSSGHPFLSEEWTSDPRDWDMNEGDQALVSKTKEQDNRNSTKDQGFDDSYDPTEEQSEGLEPSTSRNPQEASYSDEQLLSERMKRDFSVSDPKYHPKEDGKEILRQLNNDVMESFKQDKVNKSLEFSVAPERDSESDLSNINGSFVAVPTPVEFDDATTSQTESNNILSIKGKDAHKKNREVKTGPVRHNDPYPIFEHLQLSYEEAFFLSYGLGCLNLKNTNKEQMDLTEMWRTFRRHQPSFVANYIVYHFFRSKGWVPKTGLKFGADFILYKKGPPFYHASYCVYVFMVNEEDIDQHGVHKINWSSLMGRDRVIENAAKELMFCFVIKPSKLRQKDLESPACIPQFKVQEMLMKRWVPSRGRQQNQMDEEVT